MDIHIQLKATTQPPTEFPNHFSYTLQGTGRYDDLRSEDYATPRILVVMFLDANDDDWLSVSEEELILRKSAYWLSLRGAPASPNSTSQTIYLPKTQLFTPEALKGICASLSRAENLPFYQL